MESRLAAGDKQLAAGELEIAEAEYRAALRLSPNDPIIFGRLGILSYKQGRVLSAYTLLQGVLKTIPEDAQLRLHFGLASLSMAKTADARNAAKKVLETLPTNEEAVLLLVETCVTTRDNEESRRIIEKLQEQHKNISAYHVALGTLSLVQKDLAGAEAEFRKALAIDPKSGAAHSHMANLYLARNDSKQALDALKVAADMSPLRSPRRMRYIETLLRAGNIEEAKKEIAKITSKAADYVPAWTAAMKIAFRENKHDEADKLAEKVIALDRLNYEALMQRAAIKVIKGDIDGVIAALKNLETHYNGAPQIKYQLALAYIKKNEPFLAEENLHRAIQLSPAYDEAIFTLAELNLKKGDAQATVNALNTLLKRAPGIIPAYVLLAKAYQALGNPSETLKILQSLADATPKSPESSYLLGMALSNVGRQAEARAAFERAVQNSENYWPAVEMLVEDDLARNQKTAAADRVEALIAKYPKVAGPLLFRAKIRLFDNNPEGAEADLLKALEVEPSTQFAYFQLARIYLDKNRGQEAVNRLTASATAMNTAGAYMRLGMLHDAMNQADLARQAYEKALTLDPRFVPALNNLALIYAEKLGQMEKALSFAQQAKDRAPSDPMVADTLGWVHFRRGQYENALSLLQVSAEAFPGDPQIQYHLAMAHYQLGQEEAARQIFQRINNLTGDSSIKEDARGRLALLAIDPAKASPAVRANLEERLKREPTDLGVLTRLAAIKEHEGAAREAAGHYEAALKITPRSFSTVIALLNLYVGPLKDLAKAREIAKNAHNVRPTDSQAAWRFGRLVYETGDYTWSVNLLQEAARQLPNQPNIVFDLAQAQYAMGRVADAEASLKQALASNALSSRETVQRTATLIAASKTPAQAQAALPEAQKVLATEPTNIPALMVTALAAEQQKDFRGARQIYEKVLTANGSFTAAVRNLAILYADQLGDDQKGEELGTKARVSFPDDPELAFTLGTVNYRKGDYVAAVRFLKQSLSKRDNHAETLFFLGMAQFQLKNMPESRTQLQRALQLGLPPQEVQEARRILEEMNRQG